MLTAAGLTDPLVFIGGLELQVCLDAPVWIRCLLPQVERDPPVLIGGLVLQVPLILQCGSDA